MITKEQLAEIRARAAYALENGDTKEAYNILTYDIPLLLDAVEELEELRRILKLAVCDLKHEAAEALSDAQWEYTTREALADEAAKVEELESQLAERDREIVKLKPIVKGRI